MCLEIITVEVHLNSMNHKHFFRKLQVGLGL